MRAFDELLMLRRELESSCRREGRVAQPWVIHGFNSSVETMRQLLRYDIYISLGDILYRNENQAIKILKNTPVERLFLETDVSGRDIRDVYAKAAALMGCNIDILCNNIFEAAH